MEWSLKPSKWLLLFLGNSKDIQKDVETNLIRASQIIGRDVPPYEVQSLDTSKTKKFPTGVTVENEIEEEFNEKILNDLISRKKSTVLRRPR